MVSAHLLCSSAILLSTHLYLNFKIHNVFHESRELILFNQ